MTEHDRARQWRLARNLTPQALSTMIGYSIEAIYAMERGEAPGSSRQSRRPVKARPWRRYKCCCAAVDAWFRHAHNFDWR